MTTIQQLATAGEYKNKEMDQTLVWHMEHRRLRQMEIAAIEAARQRNLAELDAASAAAKNRSIRITMDNGPANTEDEEAKQNRSSLK